MERHLMAIFQANNGELVEVLPTTFAALAIKERAHIQQLLINPNVTDADGIVTHTLRGPAGTVLPQLLAEAWPNNSQSER
jgi:hypothetical protein